MLAWLVTVLRLELVEKGLQLPPHSRKVVGRNGCESSIQLCAKTLTHASVIDPRKFTAAEIEKKCES
jgi:hypothetical protein